MRLWRGARAEGKKTLALSAEVTAFLEAHADMPEQDVLDLYVSSGLHRRVVTHVEWLRQHGYRDAKLDDALGYHGP